MSPLIGQPRSTRPKPLLLGALLVVATLALAHPANAQAVLVASPDFPDTVTVGQTFEPQLTLAPGLATPPPSGLPPVL